jgi:hypothetical protein
MGLELYYGAYLDLMSSRNSGFGLGRISYESMVGWGKYAELSDEQMEDLLYFIPQMDNAYIGWHNEKNKS